MNMKNAGPELADLQLVGVYQDLRNSADERGGLRERSPAAATRCGSVMGWAGSASARSWRATSC